MGSAGAGHGGAPLTGCGAGGADREVGDPERSSDEPVAPPHTEASSATINESAQVDLSRFHVERA
jgi:hypothetical protein